MSCEIGNPRMFGINDIFKNIDLSSKKESTFNKQYENRVLHGLKDIENGKSTIIHNKKEDDKFWNSL